MLCLNKVTTIKVSRDTILLLESMRNYMKAKSIDEVIKKLIIDWRVRKLNELFGADKDKIKPFTEEDRGEDRS